MVTFFFSKSSAPVFSGKQTLQSVVDYKFFFGKDRTFPHLHSLSMMLLKQWRAIASEAKHVSFTVAKFFGLLHVTDSYLCSCTLVHGPSMLPTFNSSGDVVLAEHFSHRLGKVVHGDVVLVRSPDDPKKMVAKRVLGLEGDHVTFFDPRRNLQQDLAVVPKGHVWIQGDNTYASLDSRTYGPVPYGLIQGRVFFRVWPPDGFGLVGDRV